MCKLLTDQCKKKTCKVKSSLGCISKAVQRGLNIHQQENRLTLSPCDNGQLEKCGSTSMRPIPISPVGTPSLCNVRLGSLRSSCVCVCVLVCVYKSMSATYIQGWPTSHVEFSVRLALFGMLQAASLLMSWRWMSTSVNVPLPPWVPFHLSNSLSLSFCLCQVGGERCRRLLYRFVEIFLIHVSSVCLASVSRITIEQMPCFVYAS